MTEVKFLSLIFVLTLLTAWLPAHECIPIPTEAEECEEYIWDSYDCNPAEERTCPSFQFSWHTYSLQAILRHTEGRGIGYHRGYTTLELLWISSAFKRYSLFPFIDIRGHGFNNQKLAANAGIGIRYLAPSQWIFGANLYYDFRQGSHQGFTRVGYGFQQIGIGLEALGPNWDVRFNLYEPIKKKTWNFTQKTFESSLGNIEVDSHKRQKSMRGFDLEFGTCLGQGSLFNCCLDWNAYLGFGPYYLDQKRNDEKWGGKLRLTTHFARYYLLELRASYDRVNYGAVQVRLGVTFPLYPSRSKQADCCQTSDSCCEAAIRTIISQPVERMEIMPLREHRRDVTYQSSYIQ